MSTKLLLFYSPQGGTGKSTIAVNVSILASYMGIKTLLIDFANFGSVASILRLQTFSKDNLSDLIDIVHANKSLPDHLFEQNLLPILNNNLFIIQNCDTTKMIRLNTDIIGIILQKSVNLGFDLVVIDSSSDLNKKNLFLIENSHHIVIPTIQDISCSKKIVDFRELINKGYMKNVRLGTVLNMCNKSTGFINSKYELETGIKNLFQLPYYSKNFQASINNGYLINSGYNKPAYTDFTDLTKILLTETGINLA
jgi:MinD-like ATPase involved in chromosome partitioning or flagellar assembly